MKAKNLRRVIALLLTAMMVFSACGQKEVTSDEQVTTSTEEEDPAKEEAAESNDEIVNLTLYSAFNNGGSDAAPWFQEYLKETLGVTLESTTYEQGMMPSLLASGELPDIVGFSNVAELEAAIEGGLIINLEEYKEQLPSVFEDEFFDKAIQYSRDAMSAGTGELYSLPINVGANDAPLYERDIRWDIYKEIGYPEINSPEELLDVLKQMQEVHPTTEDGQPMYAFTFWNDWDSTNMVCVNAFYTCMLGYNSLPHIFLEMKTDGTEGPRSVFEDDSVYKAGLQYLFDANQMGLVDPDSVTQKWDMADGKMKNGNTYFTPYPWWRSFNKNLDSEDFVGYYSLSANFLPPMLSSYLTVGAGYGLAISSSCENIDKALEFLNWYYSEEGVELIYNGPEGFLWEYDENGMKVPTDLFLEEGTAAVLEGGGTVGDARSIINGVPRSEDTKNKTTGQRLLATQDFSPTINALTEDWADHNGGYYTALDKEVAAGATTRTIQLDFMPAESDEMVQLTNQIGELLKTTSWKMVFAENQAEFDALWEQLKEDAKEIGVDAVVEDALARWEEAGKVVSAYVD